MENASRPLEHTFLHLPRVGQQTERRFWSEGILTWSDLEALRQPPPDLFGRSDRDAWLEAIDESREALGREDADFFASRLPSREHYRIAATFPAETVFLDIETTGLSLYYDSITLIGTSRGDRYVCHLAGTRNEAWRELLTGAKCLVTFNGTTFDLKFLAKHVPNLRMPVAHVDLRYLARRVSLAGGQKAVEGQLGVIRPGAIDDVNGAGAVRLWYEYKAGQVDAGQRLVQYNHADVEGMKKILDETIRRIGEDNTASAPIARCAHFSNSPSSIHFETLASGRSNFIHVPIFQGRQGPVVTYDDLFGPTTDDSLSIIGVDLTGSELRATGWCRLDGRTARTELIRTDNEMIDAIRAAKPCLVSIDSPLSLPKGRSRVGDDDPGRASSGIMRECERMLKRRGINVYPCLIPSMQKLTERGILLAEKIRSLGVPVIESYPGAAQDIMNIPRKRASLDQLQEGLRLFGIRGEFLSSQVTHDELDAITSAIVGLFFWSGRFEALGNRTEDYLIIPDPRRDTVEPSRARRRRVVGVSGPIAAGKTTAALYLEKAGFTYGRYSQIVADLARERGQPVTRASLQKIGGEIHRDPGQRWLNQQLLSRLSKSGGDFVIDGLRWPEDHAFWMERFGPAYLHLHVQAASDVRRGRYTTSCDLSDEFDKASGHEVEKGVDSLRLLADRVLRNEQTPERLEQLLLDIVEKRFEEVC